MNLSSRVPCLTECLLHGEWAVMDSSWLSLWCWREHQAPLQQDAGTCFSPQIEFLGWEQAAAGWAKRREEELAVGEVVAAPTVTTPYIFVSDLWRWRGNCRPPQPRVVRWNIVGRKHLAWVGSLRELCVHGFPWRRSMWPFVLRRLTWAS